MDYDLMISQCNEHNEINLILSKKMNIKKIKIKLYKKGLYKIFA